MGESAEVERAARDACARADFSGAAAMVVKTYGPEIFGFLVATHRSEQDASDVFSDFCVALLRGIEHFRFKSSLRTWSYVVARNASLHFRRDTGRASRRRAGASELDAIAAGVRTSTLGFLQTQKRTALERLRDALDPDDRELLILRVDRKLEWLDVALAFHEGTEDPTADDLAKASARLRKRFQHVKDRLRDEARRQGLA